MAPKGQDFTERLRQRGGGSGHRVFAIAFDGPASGQVDCSCGEVVSGAKIAELFSAHRSQRGMAPIAGGGALGPKQGGSSFVRPARLPNSPANDLSNGWEIAGPIAQPASTEIPS